MCSLEKGILISCQITYFPINSKKYLDEIKEVLDLIKASGLDHNVDVLSTTIRGEAKNIFNLIADIHEGMSFKSCNYTMNIMISNICGC